MIYVRAKFHIYNGHKTERQRGVSRSCPCVIVSLWPLGFIVHSADLLPRQEINFSLYVLSRSIF